jgi:hypothetical protein
MRYACPHWGINVTLIPTPLATTAALIALTASASHAAVTISSGATSNMSCANGICAPTATDAVLNVGDLESLLASGNVEVTTTGSGGVQASDIAVSAGLAWNSGTTLTLDAYHSLAIGQLVSVKRRGGLAILTDDGGMNGTLSFPTGGRIAFGNTASALAINGTPYTLVKTISALATAVAANPGGNYALAGFYDASQDGTYTSVPVPTPFTGTFEGLGNTIAHLSVNDTADLYVGLFAELDTGGTLRDLRMSSESVSGGNGWIGGLVGFLNGGSIVESSTGGKLSAPASGPYGYAGGLVGLFEYGTIELSHSSSETVSAFAAGGLAGLTDGGTIDQSFARVKASGIAFSGGLVASNNNGSTSIINSYALGTVKVSSEPNPGDVGGISGGVGSGNFQSTYSAATAEGGDSQTRGGFIGYLNFDETFSNCYWDTTRSKKGIGNDNSAPGLTGLTSKQLKSGLPAGFDPTIWAENANINDGLPYLTNNPPSQ